MGLLVDVVQMRKSIHDMWLLDRNFPNVKAMVKKKKEYLRAMEQPQKCGALLIGLSEDKREYKTEEAFEMIMTVNFTKLMLDVRTPSE